MNKTSFIGFGDCDDNSSDFDEHDSYDSDEVIEIRTSTKKAPSNPKTKGRPAHFAVGGKMDANRSLTINDDNVFGDLLIDKQNLVTKRQLDIYRGYDPKGQPILLKTIRDVPRGLVLLLTQIKVGNKFESLQEQEKKQKY